MIKNIIFNRSSRYIKRPDKTVRRFNWVSQLFKNNKWNLTNKSKNQVGPKIDE